MEGDTESSRDVGMSRTLWRLPSYAEWFTADTATAIGVALRSLAISLIGYSVSHSTIAAGWLGSASMIAQQSCGVFGGTFVDRHDRRTLIIINAIVSLLCWGTVTGLLISNALTYWVLLLLAILSSAVNGFLGSASDAMLKSIINASDYPKARSLNEGRDAAVNMAGSPLGGFLYGVKPWLPFLVTSCMYAIAGVAATRIRKTQTDQQNQQIERQSFLTEFKEGWAWSFHRKMLVVVMVISALLNFGINGIQYGIQLHLVSRGVNGAHIGFVNTGIFCAMLVGAFVSNRLSDRLPVGPVVCMRKPAVQLPDGHPDGVQRQLLDHPCVQFPLRAPVPHSQCDADGVCLRQDPRQHAGAHHCDSNGSGVGALRVLQCGCGQSASRMRFSKHHVGVPSLHADQYSDSTAVPPVTHDSAIQRMGAHAALLSPITLRQILRNSSSVFGTLEGETTRNIGRGQPHPLLPLTLCASPSEDENTRHAKSPARAVRVETRERLVAELVEIAAVDRGADVVE
ncbi:MFS transporter [Bifidobacterium animalis]|uniref:MFS transporter n=1 Tax=Bifidobacterium animalis TaxID=28025 RepID=UPI001F4D2053|nr:MFS transporter [Bifidobacterium animalis]